MIGNSSMYGEVNKALAIWTGKAMPGWAEKVLEQIRMEQQQLRGQGHFLDGGCCGNAPQIFSGIMLGLDSSIKCFQAFLQSELKSGNLLATRC